MSMTLQRAMVLLAEERGAEVRNALLRNQVAFTPFIVDGKIAELANGLSYVSLSELGVLFGHTFSVRVESSGAFNDFDISAGLVRFVHNGVDFMATLDTSTFPNQTTLSLGYDDGIGGFTVGRVTRDPGTGVLTIP